MHDSYKGGPLNGTPEDLRDAIAFFAEQLGFEVVYDKPVPQEEQDNKEKKITNNDNKTAHYEAVFILRRQWISSESRNFLGVL